METAYGNSKAFKSDIMRYGQGISRIIGLLLLSLAVVSCSLVRQDGPYKGRVIDADTGRPIEGVVILGVWYKEISTAAGGVSSYYDAKEAVTEKDGEFEIRGVERKLWTYVGPMNVLIFKAGYEYVGSYEWDTLKVDPRKITWEGSKPIIPLRRLTMEERRKLDNPPSRPSIPEERMIILTNEINRERAFLGLSTL